VVHARVTGCSRSTGLEVTIDYAQILTLRDGKIVRGREYRTEAEALAAAAELAERAARTG
jgi:ketosteroid isomerase-like protein